MSTDSTITTQQFCVHKILNERERQDRKWGNVARRVENDNIDDFFILAVAAEEFGEIAQALLSNDTHNIHEEITHCAAVLLFWLEVIGYRSLNNIPTPSIRS